MQVERFIERWKVANGWVRAYKRTSRSGRERKSRISSESEERLIAGRGIGRGSGSWAGKAAQAEDP